MSDYYSTIQLYGLNFANITLFQAAQTIVEHAHGNGFFAVNFANSHCINISTKNDDYYNVLKNSDLLLADGSGLSISAKLNNKKFIDNVNGTDLFPLICELAEKRDISIGLLGGKPGIARACQSNMNKRFQQLNFSYIHNGYFNPADHKKILNNINQSKCKILFVAMGVPTQELLINQWQDQLNCVAIGVGALFDFYSNSVKRAPLWMRRSGIEWVYRLLQEPKRLFSRYVIGNVVFINRAIYLRLHKTLTISNKIHSSSGN